MNIEPKVDLRDMVGTARDQRDRPTCFAFAASAAHEAFRALSEFLSTEFLHIHGVRRSHNDMSRGISASAVADALQHDGQVLEKIVPYDDAHPEQGWSFPTDVGPTYKATLEFAHRTVDEVQTILDRRLPVILLVNVTNEMYSPDRFGVVRAGVEDTKAVTRHAMVAMGHGVGPDGTYILVRNSWGPRWGLLGHAWLHENYLEHVLVLTGVIAGIASAD